MGLIKDAMAQAIGNVAKGAVIDAAADVLDGAQKGIKAVGDAVDKTFGDKDVRHYRKEQKYLAKNADSTYLIIQKANVKQDIFSIYDVEEVVKYYVQGKLSSKAEKVNLKLLDDQKKVLASVRKAAMTLRAPVFHESKPADYILEVQGRQIAKLKTKLSLSREDYEIEPYGWTVKGSILKWDFTVYDGDTQIVHISRRKGYDSPTYILDFPNSQHELI